MNKTGIEYLTHTWNPVIGCTKGCPECWARARAKDIAKNPIMSDAKQSAYAAFNPVLFAERLGEPRSRRDHAAIGVCFMGDLFDPSLDGKDRAAVFGAMDAAKQHTYILLTKQPEIMLKTMEGHGLFIAKSHNWYLGFSARTQEEFDDGWPHMARLAASGWKVWVSLEPLQGPVDLGGTIEWENCLTVVTDHLSGVIVGAQSGKDAPPLNTDWVRSIRDQCAAAEVDFMYKQGPSEAGKLVTLPDLDGVKHTALAWGKGQLC